LAQISLKQVVREARPDQPASHVNATPAMARVNKG